MHRLDTLVPLVTAGPCTSLFHVFAGQDSKADWYSGVYGQRGQLVRDGMVDVLIMGGFATNDASDCEDSIRCIKCFSKAAVLTQHWKFECTGCVNMEQGTWVSSCTGEGLDGSITEGPCHFSVISARDNGNLQITRVNGDVIWLLWLHGRRSGPGMVQGA